MEKESSDPDEEGNNEESNEDDEDDNTESADDEYEGFNFLQKVVLCSIQDKPAIPKSLILLDSQSTEDVFLNPRLSNIQDVKWTLTLYCNAGKTIVTNKGDLKG